MVEFINNSPLKKFLIYINKLKNLRVIGHGGTPRCARKNIVLKLDLDFLNKILRDFLLDFCIRYFLLLFLSMLLNTAYLQTLQIRIEQKMQDKVYVKTAT